MTLLLALSLLVLPAAEPPQQASDHKALVGKPAPAIKAEEWIPAAPSWKGKVVLLDFWATWCGPCIAQFPTMKQWKSKFGDELVIVGMTGLEGQTVDEVKAFLAKDKLPWPVAIDHSGATHKAFGVVPLPHTVVIDRQGIVRTVHVGGTGFADLLPGIEKLIGEK